jgi:hypothetical protein
MPARIIPSSFPIGTPFDRLTTTTLPYQKQRMRRQGPYLDWYVTCRCSCGDVKEYILLLLRRGATRSCGCLKSDRTTERNIANKVLTHPNDPHIHATWCGMRRRCRDPKVDSFKRYGGRGIKVCESWERSYPAFREWALNHPAYQDGLSIERLDNDGDYEPGNCTWIPLPEQALNRSTTKFFEYQGESKLLWEWAVDPRCVAPSVSSLYQRLDRGWSFEDALTTPATREGIVVTEDQVREIRAEHASGTLSQREIAARHGVAKNTVSQIVNWKTWIHVE